MLLSEAAALDRGFAVTMIEDVVEIALVSDGRVLTTDAEFGIVDDPGSFANAGTCPTWPEGSTDRVVEGFAAASPGARVVDDDGNATRVVLEIPKEVEDVRVDSETAAVVWLYDRASLRSRRRGPHVTVRTDAASSKKLARSMMRLMERKW